MSVITYPYSLLNGLSGFWLRFFNDANQLSALYKGTAIQLGQCYLDYMSATLGISLRDCIALDRELYQLITISEDEVELVVTPSGNTWVFDLPAPTVGFASLDNQVVNPTASLEPFIDYTLANGVVSFNVDPTNPPANGYASRTIDANVGGEFTDATVPTWLTTGVQKGDTIRVLDVGNNGIQYDRGDYPIVVVRADALYVSPNTPFPTLPIPPVGVNYVILRVPADNQVFTAPFTLSPGFPTLPSSATLPNTRIDQGSATVYAQGPTGANVVEGTDYVLNYEQGVITALTVWQSGNSASISYTWREEVLPLATTGVTESSGGTTPTLQLAFWAPDALVDRMTLANNFGAMIGRSEPSSESYRAFLQGIFQLYVSGPVLDRIESALNVVMNLPVVQNDGEVYQSVDASDPTVVRVLTTGPGTGQNNAYVFPVGTPLADIAQGTVLSAFQVLTTAVTVTDYVETPSWWYNDVIPDVLFSSVQFGVPPISRRFAGSQFVQHVVNPDDGALVGDPGLYVGASDDGNATLFTSSQPIYRHRLAFVLMDQYLKYHTFGVTFDASALSAIVGTAFSQSIQDLNDLVLSARPAHTYPFVEPTTSFTDTITVVDNDITFDRLVGSRVTGPDQVLFTDDSPTVGEGVWLVGDFWTYELYTVSTAFPSISAPVTLANAPTSPRHGALCRVYVAATVSGVAAVENIDYTVSYPNRTVTRLTAWDSTTVNVTYRQVDIGNLSTGSPNSNDMPLLVGGIDPAVYYPAYDGSVTGWDGTSEPASAPRDIGLIERPLIVEVS